MINLRFPMIFYGGDYNPDQWPEEIWKEDMRLFKLAGINTVTLPVFSWAKLQPSEDTYNFEWLDRIMNLIAENGIHACLATPTAAQPAWMAAKYPEMMPVDKSGRRRLHGKRVNFCPNSKIYRKFATNIARKMAERYKDHPALAIWHIANEYGTYCYCEECTKEFRKWLQARYGTIEELNKRWNLSFWGHTVYSWDEVVLPSDLNDDNKYYQPKYLDYLRFMTDSSLGCYLEEYKVIKEITPDIKIMTNISGQIRTLDLAKFAQHMDIVGWDNYPRATDNMSTVALKHDLMRGLKDGQPYMMVEQTPSQQNWQPYNTLKRPGVMRLLSYQAIAHGSDTVMFFQLRRSIGGVEKLHGAVIEHCGHENTRVFRECAQLGKELKSLGDSILDSRIEAKVGIIFDWDNWWAVENSSGPSKDLNYFNTVDKYYKAFYDMNIPVDIIRPNSDLSRYDIVVAPLMYMVKPGVAENLEKFVDNGGTFITSVFSGIVDENDIVTLGGYPGKLRKLLGIWVEEIDALLPGSTNGIVVNKNIPGLDERYECSLLCDLLHLEGAESLAVYESDFYAGMPCLTRNNFGKGKAYYVATDPEEKFLADFIKLVCEEKGVKPLMHVPKGVEVTQRVKDGRKFTFLLNHNTETVTVDIGNENYREMITDKTVSGSISLEAKGVAILEKV